MSLKNSVLNLIPLDWMRSRRGPFRTVATALAAVLAMTGALVAVTAVPAVAASMPLSQTSIITNNLQGGTAGPDSKWTTDVPGFVRIAPIVLLQEAGAGAPAGSTPQANIVTADGDTVGHNVWQVDHGVYSVFFLQTDNNGGTGTGGRVNIAIVTRLVPDEVRVVDNPVQAGRRALGVRFGNNWYFTLHGLSNGGNDSSTLVNAIATTVYGWNANYTYTIGGDFNRDPATLTIPNNARSYTTGRATHQGGGELDYFVTNDPSTPAVGAELLNGGQSDHYPVMVGGMRAAAGPPTLEMMINGDPIIGSIPNETLLNDKYFWTLAESIDFKRSVDFVGSGTSSDGTPIEGAPGEEINAIATRDATDIPKYKPNVVFLQAGTWDIRDGDSSGASDRLSALVDQIQKADPSTVVVVANLAPTTNAAQQAQVTTFNTAVQQMVTTKVAAGRRVVLADLSDLTTADVSADGVTPSASGQEKIAESFNGGLIWAEVMGWISSPQTGAQPSGSTCDIYTFYGTPCVGAYSMTRAMYADYAGPLYQVKRASDGATDDIGLAAKGGTVKASDQDAFCAGTSCTVTLVYDQSPQANDLSIAPGGGAAPGADKGADASALPITVGGAKAYGLDITQGTGYRDNFTRGVAVNGQPEGMYMVASGTNVNSGCCFDFGNAETSTHDTGNGHMDAVNLSTTCYFQPCSGTAPWVEADMENGLFQGGNGSNTANKGNGTDFVTALLKDDGQTTYALKGGDSTSGGLTTWYDGDLPNLGGYKPMQQEGAILLGIGGDNSNSSIGSFFEGVMTAGYPSDAADDAVQANIVSAGYAGSSGGAATAVTPSAAGPAVVHDGYSSVYSVNSANGHLQESYLPKMGAAWATQDLSAEYGTPTVLAGTQPVSVVHDGYTSVYTVDVNGDLQETYLPKMGDPWSTQNLSVEYGAPPTNSTPTAVVHDGYTSLYTVVASSGDLQETYLPKMGDPWSTQDLSAEYGTPQVEAGTSPVSAVHDGYTSVYTVDGNQHLQETFLPKMGDRWSTQDLSAEYGTPVTTVTPTAVVHTGYTSVYTVDAGNQDLQETFLPKMGDRWSTQDLSATYGTPPVAPGTAPEALVHSGYTSLYTVDQASHHLQETYLPAMGDPWSTQDLTAKYGTPVTVETPIVLLHPDETGALGYSSVYTVDQFNDHLQETFLPKIGDPWSTQDLSARYGSPPVAATGVNPTSWSAIHDGYSSVYTVNSSNAHLQETYLTAMGKPWATQDLSDEYGTPAVMGGAAAASLTHDGYTSVYTIDASNGHLQETYLTAMGKPWITQDLSTEYGTPASKTTPTAVVHEGYTSIYTIDSSNGHLDETYLTALGHPWVTQDLSAEYGTPAVATGTFAASILHTGFLSVYTVDAASNHLQETYLPALGHPWVTQDLSNNYGTPAVAAGTSPAALVHSGYTSVFTIDATGNHLQETYLPAMGDPWVTQDLSATYGTPAAASGTSVSRVAPVALYHTGYASVYTIDQSNNHVQETYLPAMGDPWVTLDLSANYGTPATNQPPSPLLHYDANGAVTFTSIYTVNQSDLHLWETYLPAIGAAWATQDLSAAFGTPPV